MSTKYRISNNDSGFNTAANWGGGVALVDGDDARITVDLNPQTTALANGSIDLNSLVVERARKVTLGGAGGPLIIDIDNSAAGYGKFFGDGDVYLAPPGTLNKFEFSPESSGNKLVFSGSGTLKEIHLGNGQCTISDDVAADGSALIVITGGAHWIKYKASRVWANIRVLGGSLLLQDDFTALKIGGSGVVDWNSDGVTGGTVEMAGGPASRLNWLNGALGAIDAYSGIFDRSGLLKAVNGGALRIFESCTEFDETGTTVVTFASRTPYGRGPRKGNR